MVRARRGRLRARRRLGRLGLDDEAESADLLRAVREADLLRLAVGADGHFGAGQLLRPALAAEHDGHLGALVAGGRQLELERDDVVDEDHVVHQQVAEPQFADRLVAAQADQQQRHALAGRVGGAVGQRGSFRIDAVGEDHDRRRGRAAEVVQHAADGRPQPRALAPRRRRAELAGDAGRVGMGGGLQTGEVIEAELVVPRNLRQHRGVVLRQQRAGQVPAAELRVPLAAAAADAGAADPLFQGLAQPWLVAVHHGHAQRVVDQHGHVGQTGPLQGDRHLGDHQQRQADQRQPHDRQHGAIAAAGAAAFPRVDGRHEDHRRHDQQQRHPRRPGPLVIQPPVRTFPRPGLDAEPSLQPDWKGAAHVP